MADAVSAPNTKAPAAGGEAGVPGKSPFGLSFLDHLADMPVLRQVGLMVGLAASIAIGFGVVLWSQEPDYRPLLTSLSGADTSQVVDALTAADISYRVDPNSGALLVRSEDFGRARLKLAAAGVAPADKNIGFELLDRDQGLGSSQFIETVRYRRGLEGELARTISSLNNVKGARVHLAIPKSSVFVRDERKPSASVLVELYPGRSLDPSQVMAIVNLVATSVPELEKSQVTVVDQQGRLLSDQQEMSALSMASKQFDYTRRLENVYTQRVQNILGPVIGGERFKAEVSADVDFNAVESTSETFNPDQPALRSEQVISEEKQSSQGGPSGVPGALSNQPPPAAGAPAQAGGGGAAAGGVAPGRPLTDSNGDQIIDPKTGRPMLAPYPSDNRSQALKNYELDRSVSHTRQQQGRLKRLSVAVVVDDQVHVNEKGETVRTPWTADELARFTRLVQDAVGYDAGRGDSVSVINTSFAAPGPEPDLEIPFYTQPWFWDIAKQALGALFLLVLVFGVLRPLLRNLSGAGGDAKALVPAGDIGGLEDLGQSLDELAGDQVSLGSPALSSQPPIMLPSPTEGYDAQLTAIKGLIAQDPGRVALVVKDWINAED